MSAVEARKRSPWVKGCAIGCGAALVLALVLAAAGYVLCSRGVTRAKQLVSAQLRTQYDTMNSKEKLSPEQKEIFGNLVPVAEHPQTPVMQVVVIAVLFRINISGEEKDSVDSLAAASDLQNLIKSHPQAGFREISRFLEKYPQLQASMGQAVQDMLRPRPEGKNERVAPGEK